MRRVLGCRAVPGSVSKMILFLGAMVVVVFKKFQRDDGAANGKCVCVTLNRLYIIASRRCRSEAARRRGNETGSAAFKSSAGRHGFFVSSSSSSLANSACR